MAINIDVLLKVCMHNVMSEWLKNIQTSIWNIWVHVRCITSDLL